MIKMSVGDENMGDRLSRCKRAEKSGKMRCIGRSGIDHGNLAFTNDVAVRPVERHR